MKHLQTLLVIIGVAVAMIVTCHAVANDPATQPTQTPPPVTYKVIWAGGTPAAPNPPPKCPIYAGSDGQEVKVVVVGTNGSFGPAPAGAYAWSGLGDCGFVHEAGVHDKATVRSTTAGSFAPSVTITAGTASGSATGSPIEFKEPKFEDFGAVAPSPDGPTLAEIVRDTAQPCGATEVFNDGWLHWNVQEGPLTLKGYSQTVAVNPEREAVDHTCSVCGGLATINYEETRIFSEVPGKFDFTFPLDDPKARYNRDKAPCNPKAVNMTSHERKGTVCMVDVAVWLQPTPPTSESDPPVTVGAAIKPAETRLCDDCDGFFDVASLQLVDVTDEGYSRIFIRSAVKSTLRYSQGFFDADWDGKLYRGGDETSGDFRYCSSRGYRFTRLSFVAKDTVKGEPKRPNPMEFAPKEFMLKTSIGAGTTALAGEGVTFSIVGGSPDYNGCTFRAEWTFQNAASTRPARGRASNPASLMWLYDTPPESRHVLDEPLSCSLEIYDATGALKETQDLELPVQVLFNYGTLERTDNYANTGGPGNPILPNWMNHFPEDRDHAVDILRLEGYVHVPPDVRLSTTYPGIGEASLPDLIDPAGYNSTIEVPDSLGCLGPLIWSNPEADFPSLDPPDMDHVPAGKLSVRIPRICGIDRLTKMAYHELEHVRMAANWRPGGDWHKQYGAYSQDLWDQDGDRLPDEFEVKAGLNPFAADSYPDFYHGGGGVGDFEIMADVYAQDHVRGNDAADWSILGLQSYPGAYWNDSYLGLESPFYGRPVNPAEE